MKRKIIRLFSLILFNYDKFMGDRISQFLRIIQSERKKKYFRNIGSGGMIRKDVKIVNPQWMSIGSDVVIGDRVTISTWLLADQKKTYINAPKLEIGNNCRFGDDSHITAANYIKIGDNLLTGKKVLISDNSHGYVTPNELSIAPLLRPISSKGPVIIGNNVWIGENVAILQGVTIGDGVIIGANSVVTKNIDSYCVVAGNPARVVKKLYGK